MLTFIEAAHSYHDNGVRLPSVTEICAFAHGGKYQDVKPHLRDLAAARGTLIHELCTQMDIEGVADSVPAELAGYLKAYADFKRDYRVDGWTMFERMVGGKKYGYAGTLDRAGVVEGKFTILDIKTGSSIDKLTLWAQLSGYYNAAPIPEEYLVSANVNLMGLQLKKTGQYTVYEFDPFKHSPWELCLKLYKMKEDLKCRKQR